MDTFDQRSWCPTCACLQSCVEERPAPSSTASSAFDVFYAHHGVQWFWRTRACVICGTKWYTVEVPEYVLHKGIQWRDAFLKAVEDGENKESILLKLASRADAIGQIEDPVTRLDASVKLVKALCRLHRRSTSAENSIPFNVLMCALPTEI